LPLFTLFSWILIENFRWQLTINNTSASELQRDFPCQRRAATVAKGQAKILLNNLITCCYFLFVVYLPFCKI
jgi:hypothetical protein